MDEKAKATKALELLRQITVEICEGDSPVYQALENCRYALEEIQEG